MKLRCAFLNCTILPSANGCKILASYHIATSIKVFIAIFYSSMLLGLFSVLSKLNTNEGMAASFILIGGVIVAPVIVSILLYTLSGGKKLLLNKINKLTESSYSY